MNRKMKLSIVTASVLTGLVLVSSVPTLYAHGQSMETVPCHPGKHITAQHLQAGTGSDVIGFGEYDPAQLLATAETVADPGNVTPGMANAHEGFAEIDPSGSAMTDTPELKGHQVTPKMAASSAGRMTARHEMAGDCPKKVASAGEPGS